MRAALRWAFGARGNAELGAQLVVFSLPFGFQLSSHEFARRAALTIEILRRSPQPSRLAELRVRGALTSIAFQTGEAESVLEEDIRQLAVLAEEVRMPTLIAEALTARAVMALEKVDYVEAVRAFETLHDLAKGADDPVATLVADRVGAQVFHWAGDQRKARVRAERALRHPAPSVPLVCGQGQIDKHVSMRIVLARISWLEGRADEALSLASEAVDRAETDTPAALCQALAFAACPIAFWRGDAELARRLTARLVEFSRRHLFSRWHRLALCFEQSLESEPSGAATPLGSLQRDLLATVHEYWVDSTTVERAERGLSGWCTSEMLRIAGILLLRKRHAGSNDAAESRFRASVADRSRPGPPGVRAARSDGPFSPVAAARGVTLKHGPSSAQSSSDSPKDMRRPICAQRAHCWPGFNMRASHSRVSCQFEISANEQVLTFGPFELYRNRKMLMESGRMVRLGSRAIELLVALVERAGEVVGKNELMAYVWPDTIVEENNLRVHITALRKCLGDGQGGARYIVNVAGRGYCFVAPVARSAGPVSALPPGAVDLRGSLPVPISRPVGRAEVVARARNMLATQRLVTIIGAGGIGKSTVAISVAEQLGSALSAADPFRGSGDDRGPFDGRSRHCIGGWRLAEDGRSGEQPDLESA